MEDLKISIISDTHNEHRNVDLPGGDLLIHTGDALEHGSMKELVNFAEWIKKAPYKEIVYVPGNHDGAVEIFKNVMNSREQKTLFGNVRVLVDEFITILDGVRIFGSPYSLTFEDYAYLKDEDEMISSFGKAPLNLDILATHCPPKGILDEITLLDGKRVSIGSSTLTEVINQINPIISCFGHAHDSRGVIKIGETSFINSNVFGSSFNTKVSWKPITFLYNTKEKKISQIINEKESTHEK